MTDDIEKRALDWLRSQHPEIGGWSDKALIEWANAKDVIAAWKQARAETPSQGLKLGEEYRFVVITEDMIEQLRKGDNIEHALRVVLIYSKSGKPE